MVEFLLICFVVAVVIMVILFLVAFGQENKIKKQKQEIDKTLEEIDKRKKYEQGVKEDNEKLSKINNGNKLSNFNDGLDLLRDE